MLREIRIRNESSSAGYQRELFGGWTTNGGCTTRQSVLIAEDRATPPSGCQIQRGRWNSLYDGQTVSDASSLDIDHMVPLEQAYVSGASRWSAGTRHRYANDLGYAGSLRAVTASTNRSKGDSDPAHWMPPRQIHRCKYIGNWIAVKYRWHLAADRSELAVLRRIVEKCGRKSDVPKPRRATVRISKAKPQRSQSHPHSGGTDRRFSTCAEAIAHGLGPYRRGKDAEYAWYRDADDDGLVCER
jgi:hypothetical protein